MRRRRLGLQEKAARELVKIAKDLMAIPVKKDKIGPGDSDHAFRLSVGISRTDKAIRSTFSKLMRKAPLKTLQKIHELEKPYIELRRKSGWQTGAPNPWEDVSIDDAEKLEKEGEELRKNLRKLLRVYGL